MNKFFLVCSMVLVFSGCTTTANYVDDGVEKGEVVVDDILDRSDSVVCGHASVRAVMKKYPGTRIYDWYAFCFPEQQNPFSPED